MKIRQNHLDWLATMFGAIAGIAELLVATRRFSNEGAVDCWVGFDSFGNCEQ